MVWCKSLRADGTSFSCCKDEPFRLQGHPLNFRLFFSVVNILETVAISLHALTLVKRTRESVMVTDSGDTVLLEGEGKRLF